MAVPIWWKTGWARLEHRAQRMSIFREESAARKDADALCARLRIRGDDDSLMAAATIEGTFQAYADLVNERQSHREKLRRAEDSLAHLRELWSRVPFQARIAAAQNEEKVLNV